MPLIVGNPVTIGGDETHDDVDENDDKGNKGNAGFENPRKKEMKSASAPMSVVSDFPL